MGRAKVAMEYIKKEKARSTTFEKRKKGIKKKAEELATLCDVPVCVIIYQQQEGPNSEADTFPSNRDHVRAIVDRYESIPREENAKRNLNLQNLLDSKQNKKNKFDQQQLSKLQSINNNNSSDQWCYPSWVSSDLDGCTKEQLLGLSSDLEYKMQAVEERIANLRRGAANVADATAATNGFGVGVGDSQIGHGFEHDQTTQWPPMCAWQPDVDDCHAGFGSSSSTVGPYYEPPNYGGLMAPAANLYYGGQLGPHATMYADTTTTTSAAAAAAAFVGGGAEAVYGGSLRFEPHQMMGAHKWYQDATFYC